MGEISTEASVNDGKAFPKVLQQVKGRPKTVIGDGAYDDRDVRDLIRGKGGKSLIPPPSNAVCHGTDLERDDAIKVIRAFGGDKTAKSIWGKLSGYSRRALVETTLDFFQNPICLSKLRFFGKTKPLFSAMCLHIAFKKRFSLSKKSSIFSCKASFERSLFNKLESKMGHI